ncbi:MAG: lipopolysaccharide transport periplasmic protein LptA [Deltaproteobacteria bacterium]|nr:lipopolysaccharide transport periplasmic protein LptA [Deltaproteobacteria bacterium]
MALKTNMALWALAASLVVNLTAHGVCRAKDAGGVKDTDAHQGAAKEKPRKPVTVTSDSMEADRGKKFVVFEGNVTAVEDFTVCSDTLYVYYDANNEVSHIEARGNVVILQADKTSRSEKARYDRKSRTVVLTGGHPQIQQCTDTVKGEKITVYIDEDKAVVESAAGGRVKAVIMPEKKCEDHGPPKAQESHASEEARCKRARQVL